jgi:hypothetical protein
MSLNPSADPTMETMILGRVLEQGGVVRQAHIVEGTRESRKRTFLRHWSAQILTIPSWRSLQAQITRPFCQGRACLDI